MHTVKRVSRFLMAIAALLQPGCGDADSERQSAPAPPIAALRDVPVFPVSIEVTHAGTADALEAAFHVAAVPDSVASWYRRQLLGAGWRLVGDMRAPDGATTLHAQRDGPPLWIIIRPRVSGSGTEYRLIGALPTDSGQPQ